MISNLLQLNLACGASGRRYQQSRSPTGPARVGNTSALPDAAAHDLRVYNLCGCTRHSGAAEHARLENAGTNF